MNLQHPLPVVESPVPLPSGPQAVFGLSVPKALPTADRLAEKVWIDIEYEYSALVATRVEIRLEGTAESHVLLGGGRRSLSFSCDRESLEREGVLELHAPSALQVHGIRRRANFYDFHNVISDSGQPLNAEKQQSETARIAARLGVSIQWFMTWKCNYKCDCCWQEHASDLYRLGPLNKTEPEVWAAAMSRLQPSSFQFSGGEPTLYRRWLEIAAELDPSTRLSVISNFGPTFKLEQLVAAFSPDRFTRYSLSLHPTECDLDGFFDKVEQLIAAGHRQTIVKMVLHPDNLPFAAAALERARSVGTPLGLVPYVPQVGQNSDALNTEMQRWHQRAKDYTTETFSVEHRLRVEDTTWSLPAEIHLQRRESPRPQAGFSRQPIFCSAGQHRVNIDDQGDVFTCISAIDRSRLFGRSALPHYQPIGNVLDPDFELLDGPIVCWESYRCASSDSQEVSPAWSDFGAATAVLPIPE